MIKKELDSKLEIRSHLIVGGISEIIKSINVISKRQRYSANYIFVDCETARNTTSALQQFQRIFMLTYELQDWTMVQNYLLEVLRVTQEDYWIIFQESTLFLDEEKEEKVRTLFDLVEKLNSKFQDEQVRLLWQVEPSRLENFKNRLIKSHVTFDEWDYNYYSLPNTK